MNLIQNRSCQNTPLEIRTMQRYNHIQKVVPMKMLTKAREKTNIIHTAEEKQ